MSNSICQPTPHTMERNRYNTVCILLLMFAEAIRGDSSNNASSHEAVNANDTAEYDVYDVIGLRCCLRDKCAPSQRNVSDLHFSLSGRVILPNSQEYMEQSRMLNTYDQRYPSIIVMVHSKEDIQKTILFARKFNLHVTIRSSGRESRGTWDGSLNINLSEMKEYSVNLESDRHPDGEIKVQTGLKWLDIYLLLDQYDRLVVGSIENDAHVSGFTLRGGHSPMSRIYGLSADNVLEIQVVLANGTVATCTDNTTVFEELDGSITTIDDGKLFWAMRGGGPGTFGVVVYYVYKLHKQPESMFYVDMLLTLKFGNFDFSTTIIDTVNRIITSLPLGWGGTFSFTNEKGMVREINYNSYCLIKLLKMAPFDGSEENLLADLLALKDSTMSNFIFANLTRFIDFVPHPFPQVVHRFHRVGTMLQSEKVTQGLTAFYKQELFENFDYFHCDGVLTGGNSFTFSQSSTPLHPGHRSATAALHCFVQFTESVNQTSFRHSLNDDVIIPAINRLSERIRKFGKGLNTVTIAEDNLKWKEDYWGEHYDRLLEIKQHYDPENFLTCYHCVGSEVKGMAIPEETSAGIKSMNSYCFVAIVLLRVM